MALCPKARSINVWHLPGDSGFGTAKRGCPKLIGAKLTNPAPRRLTGLLEAHVSHPSAPYLDPSFDTDYSFSLGCLALTLEHQSCRTASEKRSSEDERLALAASPLRNHIIRWGSKTAWHYLTLSLKLNWGRTGANAKQTLRPQRSKR